MQYRTRYTEALNGGIEKQRIQKQHTRNVQIAWQLTLHGREHIVNKESGIKNGRKRWLEARIINSQTIRSKKNWLSPEQSICSVLLSKSVEISRFRLSGEHRSFHEKKRLCSCAPLLFAQISQNIYLTSTLLVRTNDTQCLLSKRYVSYLNRIVFSTNYQLLCRSSSRMMP